MATIEPHSTGSPRATASSAQADLFGGGEDLLPLWIAEPYVELAPTITQALEERARSGWYGYELRPESVLEAFWEWTAQRHGWESREHTTLVSPSIGTSIGMLIELMTAEGDGVLLQPPVYTGFKPLVSRLHRKVVRNPLTLTQEGYSMDLEDLASKAAGPETTLMILCNPHNPIGRVWSEAELQAVAEICARNGVLVISDEIHADIVLPGRRFTPFAKASAGTGVCWAAMHGPLKTFGLAGVCDSLIVTDDEEIAEALGTRSSQLHLSRNNVFGLAAFEAGYRGGGPWLDGLIEQVAANCALLRDGLPEGIDLIEPEGTYLAWLDFRALGMSVRELAEWLPAEAGLALSPGHWFGREGAGFARMTIAVEPAVIEDAAKRLVRARADLGA